MSIVKKHLIPKTFGAAKKLEEFLPKHMKFWVIFDMSNGDSGSRRYVWWFDTKKAALEHLKHQRSNPNNAELSEPHQVQIINY